MVFRPDLSGEAGKGLKEPGRKHSFSVTLLILPGLPPMRFGIRTSEFFERVGTWTGVLFLLISCNSGSPYYLFEVLHPDRTGIHFANTIEEDEMFNIIDFTYLYNGGGVGMGDFNNDGWQDLFFAGNMVSNRLYLNHRNFQFEDIAEEAGIEASTNWCSGVSLIDINQDGWLDIYVTVTQHQDSVQRKNLLYVNNGLKSGRLSFQHG